MKGLSIAAVPMFLVGCVSGPPVPDYERFYASAPYTVVVLPPTNESVDAEATRYFLSTITQPLVNRGYYVIPVEPVADMLAIEGLSEGGALREVNPKKFREHFGADAVLYVTIKKWDTNYAILSSSVEVAFEYRLVHTDSGDTLITANASSRRNSDSGGNSLIGALISAVVTAAATEYVALAREANDHGMRYLPAGPYHPAFEEEKKNNLERFRRDREARAKAK
jgi:hypothetical protein